MSFHVQYLWLIPALPLGAAAVSALLKQTRRRTAASLAIGAMAVSMVLSVVALASSVARTNAGHPREFVNFTWLTFGDVPLRLGWVLDPLTAVMLVMICFVGLLIFIYSVGYMAEDRNFTRFFCFLSLFASAMLGLVIANSLLLLFICWELVGLTSYLLIGFWYHKPSAAAAAKKAFITTRIGDLAFLLGMLWLYSETGTLLFYDDAKGCLEAPALARLVAVGTGLGLSVATAIGVLIFLGAMGKSGQVPLHVWLPDAMEGPTPVSALIHAATMVAAGVFLIARVYPLMAAPGLLSTSLQVVTWIGVLTAVFAATIAVAQSDIKRILAYSTISQLGFMMLGLGTGGVAVGMFHLITHAFFKALLFLGAGSAIHGCHEEQDIRRMGGLRRLMPVTFATYAVGMMALSGVPLFFSGFWSKDAILHAAHGWPVSQVPFWLGLLGAFLTAFYMTRQVWYVFFGENRAARVEVPRAQSRKAHPAAAPHGAWSEVKPHESPAAMTVPLVTLAACAVVLGFIGTPAWPWFQDFLEYRLSEPHIEHSWTSALGLMLVSFAIVAGGIGAAWWLYACKPVKRAEDPDPLESRLPTAFVLLREKWRIDELYEISVIRAAAAWARFCDRLDQWLWSGLVELASHLVVALSWLSRLCDEYVVNFSFDRACARLVDGGRRLARLQSGQAQTYLRVIGLAVTLLVVLLIWGCGSQ